MPSPVRRPWFALGGFALVLLGCQGPSDRTEAPPHVSVGKPLEFKVNSSAGGVAAPSQSLAPTLATWHIGEIDPRFKISRQALLVSIRTSTSLWEAAAGKKLFQQSETQGFPVNLVFDERQMRSVERRKLKRDIAEFGGLVRQWKHYRQATLRNLESANRQLQTNFQLHEAAVKDFNSRVASLNSAGGASPDAASQLDATKASLQQEESGLEAQREQVSRLKQKDDDAVASLNKAVDAQNTAIRQWNDEARRGAATQIGVCERSFTAGVASVDKIDIYSFGDVASLTTTLAHEFGHALGIAHVPKTGALMNPVADEKELHQHLRLTPEDKEALAEALKRD